uniref:Uncharacterized protein n=1 Tax=Monopterus albus TaxID=43700 RepID=A0A3Q3IYR1_MONAL
RSTLPLLHLKVKPHLCPGNDFASSILHKRRQSWLPCVLYQQTNVCNCRHPLTCNCLNILFLGKASNANESSSSQSWRLTL